MKKQIFNVLLSGYVSLVLCGPALADVKMPAIFSDNMVLQQDREIPVWGWAEPGETVAVSLGSNQVSVTADPDGKWKALLKPIQAGGPIEMMIQGKNSITLHNILVGEVWVGSGQSNMQMSVKNCFNAEEEAARSDMPQIRLFDLGLSATSTEQADCKGKWKICTPETAMEFSAVLFFFGRELHRNLNVPVGLICSSWGGTCCEAWSASEVFSDPALRHIPDRWIQPQKQYEEKLAEWQKSCETARAENKPEPAKPKEPWRNQPQNRPSHLYNAMIAPLIPYAIRGVTWYQGESNAANGYEYSILFPAMIQNWRKNWGQGDFPFLFVQLASFIDHKPGDASIVPQKGEPREDHWAELREAQAQTLRLANTGMAVTIDIGEANDIHPRNKQDVGKRLALWALAKTYGKDMIYSGPLYKAMQAEGDAIRLFFDHVNGGLVPKDANTAKADTLEGFAIAGEDRKFVWAQAKIDGDTVVVWSPDVKNPVAVRYGWSIFPVCNLFNQKGLPASPFRTDDWPVLSTPKP